MLDDTWPNAPQNQQAPPPVWDDDPDRSRLDTRFDYKKLENMSDLFGRAAKMVTANFGILLLLTLILVTPFDVMDAYLEVYGQGEVTAAWLGMLITVIQVVTTALAVPAGIYAMVIRQREGRAVSLGEALTWGASCWLRVLGFRIVYGVCILLGLALLIVPGLIFMTWFALIDTIVTTEGRNHPGVFKRSFELSKGWRWPIVGCYILFIVGVFAFACVYGIAITGIFSSLGPDEIQAALPIAVGLQAVVTLIIAMAAWFINAVGVVVYLSVVQSRLYECPSCQYNLTGNTTGFCPECGAVIPEANRRALGLDLGPTTPSEAY